MTRNFQGRMRLMPEGSYIIHNGTADFFYVNHDIDKALLVPHMKRYDRFVAEPFENEAIRFMDETGAAEVYIDLSDAHFVDSAAIKELESMKHYVESKGRKLRIKVNPEVYELLEVSGNKSSLPLCDSIPEELYREAGMLNRREHA